MPAEKTQKTLRTVEWRQRDQFQIYTGKINTTFTNLKLYLIKEMYNFITILFFKVIYSFIEITQGPFF